VSNLKHLLQSWNNKTLSKLHAIVIGLERTVNVINWFRLSSWDQIVIFIQQLRMGHTYLTHRHLLQGQSQGLLLTRYKLTSWCIFHKRWLRVKLFTTQHKRIVFENVLAFNNWFYNGFEGTRFYCWIHERLFLPEFQSYSLKQLPFACSLRL